MSTPAKTLPVKASDSRTRLLAGASVCFLKSGFAATSLDEIAAESKVVKQTIYNHFPTKEVLFREAVDYLMHQLVINLDETWLHAEPHEFFCKIGQLNLTMLQNKRMTDLLQLAVKESKSFPELQDMYSQAIPVPVLSFVSKYLQLKTNAAPESCDVLSWAFRAAINGYATLLNTNQLVSENFPNPHKYVYDLATIFATLTKELLLTPPAVLETSTLFSSQGDEHFAEELLFTGSPQQFTANQLAIVRAALKVFADKGYLDATMADVAAFANVSKQTVYKHFKSKDEMYKTFCHAYLERLQLKCQQNESTSAVSAVLKDSKSLLALASNDWFLRLFKTVIAESYFFSEEANSALIFIFTLGAPVHLLVMKQDAGEADSSVSMTSLILASRSIAGNYVLTRQIYKLSGSVVIDENDIVRLLARLYKMMT